MANGRAASTSRFPADISSCIRACACGLTCGSKMKPMPPPDMPPSIQKPQNCGPNAARTRSMSRSVYRLLAHGMMVWIGPKKLRVVTAPMRWMSPACNAATTSSRTSHASCRPSHSASERSRYFSVTISRMGPTFCAMPPWTRTRLS